MSWSIGYDTRWQRDIGYGVPAICDYPGCGTEINRGLAHVCGGEPYGGDHGCGLFFCWRHLQSQMSLCDRCLRGDKPFEPTHDTRVWLEHKLTHDSWKTWRGENSALVDRYRRELSKSLDVKKI